MAFLLNFLIRKQNLREAKRIRDNKIKELEAKLRDYVKKIADLETENLKLKGRVLEAPQVHRVAEIEKTKVIYQADPNVEERNKMLGEEIDFLTVKNQDFYFSNFKLASKLEVKPPNW